MNAIAKTLNVSVCVIRRLIKLYDINYKKDEYKRSPMSEETRRNISQARKKWCMENPDKHNWCKSNPYYKSPPCEFLKNKLKEEGILFCEEFRPLKERAFSIDIAFPDKKVAIEVNGNQHYKSGTLALKPYYQERHDLIEAAGWFVFELHFKEAFNHKTIDLIKDILFNKDTLIEFDYLTFFNKKTTYTKTIRNKTTCPKNACPTCNGLKYTSSQNCKSCYDLKRIGTNLKIQWPSPDEMQEMLKLKPVWTISKELGVSDVAVHKFCKKNQLKKYSVLERKSMASTLGLEPRTKE